VHNLHISIRHRQKFKRNKMQNRIKGCWLAHTKKSKKGYIKYTPHSIHICNPSIPTSELRILQKHSEGIVNKDILWIWSLIARILLRIALVMMIKVVLVVVLFVANVWASVDLNPPPTCYETCLSQTLEKVGCQFSNVLPFLLHLVLR